ncbi:nuclease-related domain-containing DEAD/DEAH box helicase [Staphylococcus xylosus]|uniref:nuclease-related domain-containing DEAD/DEAH box helicase n=1 Tax=Staphylococcus xylosus TaxID=1288 RepID=UPI003F54EE71
MKELQKQKNCKSSKYKLKFSIIKKNYISKELSNKGEIVLVVLIPNDNESKEDFNNSEAEKKLYEAFENLSDDYYVFHSTNIPVKNGKRILDKEIDFIIFNPFYGILCIEVKGGLIKYEDNILRQKKSKEIYDQNSEDEYKKIYPYRQLKKVKYSLVNTLKRKYPKGVKGYELYSCVWFPDIKSENITGQLPLEYKNNGMLCKEHMNDVQYTLDKVFKDLTNNNVIRKNEESIKTVIDTIAPKFTAFIPLNDLFINHQTTFKAMTNSQIEVIKSFENNKAVLVEGLAGTGKSIIALEQAKKLTENENDTIIFCFNRLLKRHFVNRLSSFGENIKVMNMLDLYQCVNKMSPESFNKKEQEKFLQNLLNDLEKVPFKNIIIDEAQDFTADILSNLYKITQKKGGKYYAFYDLNQKHTNNNTEDWLLNNDLTKAKLYNNCRNTFEIAETISKLKTEGEMYCKHGISGTKPSMHIIKNLNDMNKHLLKRVSYYIDQGVKKSNIVILSLENEENMNKSNLDGLNISFEREEDKVLFTTARKFKGLEADVVFIVDLQEKLFANEKYRNLLYIAISRAKHVAEILVDYEDNKYKQLKNCVIGNDSDNLADVLLDRYNIELKYNY